MDVQKSAAGCSFRSCPLSGGVGPQGRQQSPAGLTAYVRNDGWTRFAWHLDKSVHP